MKSNKYAVFILTYKRPNNQITIRTLKRTGYTGRVYLVCDDEDPTLDEYKKVYGDMVQTFSKKKYLGKFDLMSNIVKLNAVVYARNAVFDIAKKLGVEYMIVMDDDYSDFIIVIDKDNFYLPTRVTDMDALVKAHLKYLASTNIDVLAFAQGGDFIGGLNGGFNRNGLRPLRKAMNVFFFRTNRPVQFNGAINEDSTMGVQEGAKGRIILTNCLIKMIQTSTQQASGGLTDIYVEDGTYQKSFYTLMASPSSVKVQYQRAVSRIHHMIDGECTYPKIISEEHRKK